MRITAIANLRAANAVVVKPNDQASISGASAVLPLAATMLATKVTIAIISPTSARTNPGMRCLDFEVKS